MENSAGQCVVAFKRALDKKKMERYIEEFRQRAKQERQTTLRPEEKYIKAAEKDTNNKGWIHQDLGGDVEEIRKSLDKELGDIKTWASACTLPGTWLKEAERDLLETGRGTSWRWILDFRLRQEEQLTSHGSRQLLKSWINAGQREQELRLQEANKGLQLNSDTPSVIGQDAAITSKIKTKTDTSGPWSNRNTLKGRRQKPTKQLSWRLETSTKDLNIRVGTWRETEVQRLLLLDSLEP